MPVSDRTPAGAKGVVDRPDRRPAVALGRDDPPRRSARRHAWRLLGPVVASLLLAGGGAAGLPGSAAAAGNGATPAHAGPAPTPPVATGATAASAPLAPGTANGPVSFSFGPYARPGTSPRPYFTFSMEPGLTVGDAVFLQNRSSFPQTFRLYATNVFNKTNGGAFAFRGASATPTGPASWIDLDLKGSVVQSGNIVVIPADTAWRIPISVTAPSGVAPGVYAAGIVALDITTIKTPSKANYIQVHEGIGSRVFMTIIGKLTHTAAVGTVWTTPGGGGLWPLGGSRQAELHVQVVNTGNSVLNRLTVARSLSPLLGSTTHLSPAELLALLPGSKVILSAPITVTSAEGPTSVHVGLTSASGFRATGGGTVWFFPWALVLVVVVVVAIVVIWIRRRRRHEGERVTATGGPARGAGRVPSPTEPAVARRLPKVPAGPPSAADRQT